VPFEHINQNEISALLSVHNKYSIKYKEAQVKLHDIQTRQSNTLTGKKKNAVYKSVTN